MDYRQAFPGERIKARYVQTALLMADPMGKHQLKASRISAEAVFEYAHDGGTETVAGGISTKIVQTRSDPVTGLASLFTNKLIPVTQETNAVAYWTRVIAVNPALGQFTVQAMTATGADYLAGPWGFHWQALGF